VNNKYQNTNTKTLGVVFLKQKHQLLNSIFFKFLLFELTLRLSLVSENSTYEVEMIVFLFLLFVL